MKLTEYVKAHNFNCNKTRTTKPRRNLTSESFSREEVSQGVFFVPKMRTF